MLLVIIPLCAINVNYYLILGDCLHGGDKYKKTDIEVTTRERCKPIHHIRLHGYITGHTTPIPDDGELVQGWFERLRRMYTENCEILSDNKRISEIKKRRAT